MADPIRAIINDEIDSLRSQGRGIRPDELAAAVEARIMALPPKQQRELLQQSIDHAIDSGQESPGDIVAKLFLPQASN